MATLLATGLIAVSPALLAVAAVLAIGVGLWVIPKVAPTGDPPSVVIDEIAGQWVALLGVPQISVGGLIAGFVLFRLLDIFKPGPIRTVERLPGALGVMADDILAGGITALVLVGARFIARAVVG